MKNKNTTAEKRELINGMLAEHPPPTNQQIKERVRKHFQSGVHNTVIAEARKALGVVPATGRKGPRPLKPGPKPGFKQRRKLSDEQVKLIVGAADTLPEEVRIAATKLRDLILKYSTIEGITVSRMNSLLITRKVVQEVSI